MEDAARPSRDWSGLPTLAEIQALTWPYGGAQTSLNSAHGLLHWSGLTDEDVQRIAVRLCELEEGDDSSKPIDEVFLEAADKIVRKVNAPGGELEVRLTDEGWLVPDVSRDTYRVQIDHVLAVGALFVGAKLVHLQSKAKTLLRELVNQEASINASDVRKALYMTELVIGCCRLSDNAMFINGRVDMQETTRLQEAQARRERAAMAGRATRVFSDEELIAFYAAWQAKHGRMRGVRTAAAANFGVTDTAIGKRMKNIRTN